MLLAQQTESESYGLVTIEGRPSCQSEGGLPLPLRIAETIPSIVSVLAAVGLGSSSKFPSILLIISSLAGVRLGGTFASIFPGSVASRRAFVNLWAPS